MKNYRIYLLALLLFVSSGSLLAIDGWWEKIETKNAPKARVGAPMCNITENKVIMIGPKVINGTLEDNTKLWLFDYNNKDWQVLNAETPDYFKRNEIPKNSLVKLEDGKALLFFGKGAARSKFDSTTGQTYEVSKDSSTWVFHFNEMRWEHIDIKSFYSPALLKDYPDLSLSNLDEGKVLLYQRKTFVFKYRDTSGRHWYDKSQQIPNYFERSSVRMARLRPSQVLTVAGTPNNQSNMKPNEKILNWLYDDNNTTWTPLNFEDYSKIGYTYLGNTVRVYNDIIMGLKSRFKDSSYFFVPKINQFFRIFNGYEARPYRWGDCAAELKDGKILSFGGVGLDSIDSMEVYVNDTWIFHADPALSVEVLESKHTQIRKLFIDDKLLITQDLLDSRIIEKAKLYNLLGSELKEIEVEGNEIQFNCVAGTYLLEIELSDKSFVKFVIIKK